MTDVDELTVRKFSKPAWASAVGRDRFGLWAEFEVPAKNPRALVSARHLRAKPGVVTQRLRWIPPGRFLMGSPADEPGRWDDEGPQREVIINQGYWLFDTPVTQALWEAITGETPSYFRSPTRPVEQVSWQDAAQFMEDLTQRVPLLRFEFPSEAEWEYACRAGTMSATYAGQVVYMGDANAPALDPIAWYGGNCGVEFDLDDGVEPSWLKDRQYEFKSGGTHAVGLKLPNAWGLYDMLGNVWEWCADLWNQKESDEVSGRVFRGGSWNGGARYVRAACRTRHSPGGRGNNLGVRCRVQEREPSS